MNANAATVAPAGALTRRAGALDALVMLMRRELWEHRSLWIAPLCVEGVLALCLIFGRINMDLPEHVLTTQQRVAIFTIAEWALAMPLFLVASIVLFFYLLDCLYAERKDRSILFWKSLPLSDEMTVGSKFLVATVAVPLGVFLLAVVGDLLFGAILALRVPGTLSWNTYEWLRTEVVVLLTVVLGVLWYAPIGGALLLLSAWARRSPVLWATLITSVAPVVERVGLGTHYIWDFERYRVNGIWHRLTLGPNVFGDFKHLSPVGIVLDTFNIRGAFTDLDLWLGVVAALALAYAAARVRRYRDDT
jgi:ABC-2 type transport system permease protein